MSCGRKENTEECHLEADEKVLSMRELRTEASSCDNFNHEGEALAEASVARFANIAQSALCCRIDTGTRAHDFKAESYAVRLS